MLNIIARFLFICCVTLLAAGCNTSPSSAGMMPVMDRDQIFDRNQDKISNLNSWQFDGRFSIHSDHGVESANLTWLQEANRYLLKISGPLQQGTIFLRGDPNGISYKDSKGVVDTAESPEALLARHTQYELPIASLRYWVVGRAAPHEAFNLTISPTGDLRTLTQQGWTIHYQAFKTIEPYRLPTKITLTHEKAEIIMSIHDWNPDLVSE